ncbi:WbqC family protein [Schlegelella sp. S2-27]|uniref:WbqC family protein n=1 Tax=Caldimonas mangrovi TaxID=2944811 RepID=A0ABT0YLY6_9BURK|nr:WbqC family protein [Caldimonas mangrovi]MCM5679384.1 WbqC family protein [Caldimonas mangrovi]
MSLRIVISQSMLFPWVGLLEQVRLADVFVHYDDVQFSKGSFVNRVQLKTPRGVRWMTVPLQDLHLGQRIDEVQIAPAAAWCARHLDLLHRSLAQAPYRADALRLAEEVYAGNHPHVGSLARASMMALVRYFGLDAGTRFVDVRELGIPGDSSERVLAVVRRLGGDTYVTGHGAARYLAHETFEQAGVDVQYMDYRRLPYPQSHGEFTPYVSGLDLVAHCGRDGARHLCSDTVSWRTFVHEPA